MFAFYQEREIFLEVFPAASHSIFIGQNGLTRATSAAREARTSETGVKCHPGWAHMALNKTRVRVARKTRQGGPRRQLTELGTRWHPVTNS